jgi:stage II sporulation protein AA (anti-sigma F factor antagonist)
MTEMASHDVDKLGGLKIQRTNDDRGAILALAGELDLESASELDRQIQEVEESNVGRLLIDLGGLEFMDSSGLAVLVRAQRSARDNGHGLALRPGPTQVQRLFELTGLLERFAFEK